MTEFEGGHTSEYWETLRSTYLLFYYRALRGRPAAPIATQSAGDLGPGYESSKVSAAVGNSDPSP